MAIAIRENRPVRDVEAIAERPDGSRICFAPYPTPLRDETGALIGAVNMLVDITTRKQSEERMMLLTQEVDHRANNLLAVIQAMLRLTKADSAEEFQAAFQGRLARSPTCKSCSRCRAGPVRASRPSFRKSFGRSGARQAARRHPG